MARPKVRVELSGVDAVNAALRKVQPHLREHTVPVMRQLAAEIAAGAKERLRIDSPSNLFRRTGGKVGRPAGNRRPRRRGTYNATYLVEQPGAYMFRVRTGSGKAAKPQALAEFARNPMTGQGRGLVNALDAVYGRSGGSGNGRVLWAVADEVTAGAAAWIQEAVDAAAAQTQSEMGGA